MDSKVIVTADAAGNVVCQSKNNPEWGYIRLQQTRNVIDDRGFARLVTVSCLVQGEIKTLKNFGWKSNQELKGRIIYKEQLTPFNSKNPDYDFKIAGKTGIVCCIDGAPIYRKAFYQSYANENTPDIFILDENGNKITHNNTEEIRLANKRIALGEIAAVEQEEPLDNM